MTTDWRPQRVVYSLSPSVIGTRCGYIPSPLTRWVPLLQIVAQAVVRQRLVGPRMAALYLWAMAPCHTANPDLMWEWTQTHLALLVHLAAQCEEQSLDCTCVVRSAKRAAT